MTAILSYRICVYAYVYEVAMQTNSRLAATVRSFLISVDAKKSRRKEFDRGCLVIMLYDIALLMFIRIRIVLLQRSKSCN